MKVALVHPGWTQKYGELRAIASKSKTWPPLNLCYIAAYAERLGHDVTIIDAESELIDEDEVVARVWELGADVVGITATTPFYHRAVELAQQIKDSGNAAAIAIGGPHITALKEKAFFRCFDYGFVGEADVSWVEFLKAMQDRRSAGGIGGIISWNGNGTNWFGPARGCSDMNAVPLPSRHLLNADSYSLGTSHGRRRMTTIMTFRGCPFDCTFCSTKVHGKKMRMRDPGLVVEEMRLCVQDYGIEHFMFLDDTLTLNRQHIMRICDYIIAEGLNITFEGSTRANLVDEEMIARMAKAGLVRLSFGLEAVDENVRRLMKKSVPLESYCRASALTNKYGVETLNSCMIGLPGETRETVKATLAFLRKAKEIKEANITIAVPYPGTELYEMAKRGEHGLKLLTEDYTQYRRYNAAVLSVGDLQPKDLVELQNEAYVSILMAPWRWPTMFRKSGWAGVWMTLKRLVHCLIYDRTKYLTNKQLGLK